MSKAKQFGLIDEIVADENWRDSAKRFISTRPGRKPPPLLDRLLGLGPARAIVARGLRKQVGRKARPDHYPAPYAIIDLWRRHGGVGQRAYDAEARSFGQLMIGETSRSLVRVFFLQNRLKSQGSKTDARIRKVHVIGAGVMGGDIASWCAVRGLTVTLQDRSVELIQPAMDRAGKLFAKKARTDDDLASMTHRLKADPDGLGVSDADLVLEAIYEDLDAKRAVYKSLEGRLQQGAVLATNTSSIRLEDLRVDLANPQQFIGLHFFNPVSMLPLVEIIRCADSDQATLDKGFAFVKSIGKLPLECSSSPGFVVNRVLAPYMAEALHLMEDGVPLVVIDRIAEDFGMPMGPVELIDSVGIDVALQVSKVLGAAFGRQVPSLLAEKVSAGKLGRKSGQGFYAWRDGKAVKPVVERAESPSDGADRLMLPMVNEAVACLQEGVVGDADLLDAGVIFGTGFAPFRGGPLHYARNRGPEEIVNRLRALASKYGDRFQPHEGWSGLS